MLIRYGLLQQPQRLVVRHPHLQVTSDTRRDVIALYNYASTFFSLGHNIISLGSGWCFGLAFRGKKWFYA